MTTIPSPETSIRTRDPERTKRQILEAALSEFAKKGYDGAKVHQIAKSAGCNARLIYHYFENKERLYAAALQRIYADLRARENDLHLDTLPPVQAIARLAETTFDFFDQNSAFLAITRNENLLGGRFIAQMPEIQMMSAPFLDKVGDALSRGQQSGVFKSGIDPLQLYVSIVSLSAHHINAAHTLSATFGTDLACQDWRQERRQHVLDMISQAVRNPESP